MTNPIPPFPGVSDTFDFVRNLWGAMNVPGLAAPTLSVDELDKRIADLKAVEAWISMNATMLRGTIHTLEVQRATIATIKSMGASLADAMPHASSAGAPEGAQAGSGEGVHAGLADSAAAWWNLLQQQFGNVVSGAMAATGAAQAGSSPAEEKPKAARKARAPRKGPAKPRA